MNALAIFLTVAAVALAAPFLAQEYRRRARVRRAHEGNCNHWYANFDAELDYEPSNDNDIERIFIDDLRARGYVPTQAVHRIPRTFREKIPGDTHMQLWRGPRQGDRPYWICVTVRRKA